MTIKNLLSVVPAGTDIFIFDQFGNYRYCIFPSDRHQKKLLDSEVLSIFCKQNKFQVKARLN